MTNAVPVRDLDGARGSLEVWLDQHVPGVRLEPFSLPAGNGGSNETLLSHITWREGTVLHRRGVVVRVEPPSRGALFFEADFANQARLMQVVREHTEVPVPEILWFEEDPCVLGAAFWVMARVPGTVPSDWPPYNQTGFLADATPAQRRRSWEGAVDSLARLHSARLSQEVDFLAKADRGPTGFDQQLWWWQHMFDWASPPRGAPALARKLEAALLSDLPRERPTELSWGDARIGNMIFSEFACRALLDWEMASLGGALEDLGWWLFLDRWSSEGFDLPRLEGLGTRADTIERWERTSGRSAAGVEWYERFAAYRMEAIMMSSARCRGTPEFAENNPVMRLIAGFEL